MKNLTDITKTPFELEQTIFWRGLRSIIRIMLFLTSISTMILIIVGVIFRYILERNFFGGEEIIILIAFWLYFVGAMHGSFERSHVKADMISNYVKNKRVRDGILLLAALIACIVCVFFTKWGFDYLMWDLRTMPRTPGLKIPLIITHSAIFCGYFLMTFYHIYYLQKDFRAYIKKPEALGG